VNARTIAAVMLPLLAAQWACHTISPVATPESYIAAERPTRLWVTRRDQTRVLVEAPKMKGDSLLGFVDNRYQVVGRLQDLQTVEARHPAQRRTALLVGGLAVGVGGLVVLLLGNAHSSAPVSDCEEDPSACN